MLIGCDEENEFTCKNNECIPNQFRCDGQLDCADDSDEHNCRKLEIIQTLFLVNYRDSNYQYREIFKIIYYNL